MRYGDTTSVRNRGLPHADNNEAQLKLATQHPQSTVVLCNIEAHATTSPFFHGRP